MRLKLLKMPSFMNPAYSIDFASPSCVPLGIGILAKKIRSLGYELDVDDLNIKYHRGKKNNLRSLLNNKRVLEYLKNQNNDYDLLLKKIFSKTNMRGYDKYLLSYESDWQDKYMENFFLLSTKYVKKVYDKTLIVGGAGSLIPVLKYLNGTVDFFIFGYGEKLLESVLNENVTSKGDGLIINEGKYVGGKQNKKFEISIIPDFNGMNLELYNRTIKGKKIKIFPAKFSNICKGVCAFCCESGRNKKNVNILSPKDAVNNIQSMYDKYNAKFFIFNNNTFNESYEWVDEFCTRIIDRKLDILWLDSARLDTDSLTWKSINKMRKAGCISLVFGLESPSQRMLDYIKKGIKIEDAKRILEMTSEAGIWNSINFIAGLPFETDDDINSMITFINKNKKIIDEYWVNAFTLREDSLFEKYPDKFNLENVKKVYESKSKGFGKGLNRTYVFYRFDEKNGLKWEKKKEQINNSFDKIINSVDIPYHIPVYNHYPILFYLYSEFKDKKIIQKEYLKFSRQITLRRLLQPQFVYQQISSFGLSNNIRKVIKHYF